MKPPKGVYQRNKASPQLWVTYVDEEGKQIKESAHTTDLEIADAFRSTSDAGQRKWMGIL